MEERPVSCPECGSIVALRRLSLRGRVAALMDVAGIPSQRELARRLSLDETTLSKVLNGTRVLSAELVVKLAEALGVSCEELAQEQEVSG